MSQQTSVTTNKNVTTQKISLESEETSVEHLEDQLVEKPQNLMVTATMRKLWLLMRVVLLLDWGG